MEKEMTCMSCKRKVVNMPGTVVFNCPVCKEKIVRCANCRAISAKYTCKCGFVGPN